MRGEHVMDEYDPRQHNHKQREELWPQSRHEAEHRKALKATGHFYGDPHPVHKEHPKTKHVKAYRVPRLMPDGTVKD
jgi:hypothetical protein